MRLVEKAEEGHIRICIEWLPYLFVVSDPTLNKDMEAVLNEVFVGEDLTEDLLDQIHNYLCQWLESRFKRYAGLGGWLKNLRGMEDLGV